VKGLARFTPIGGCTSLDSLMVDDTPTISPAQVRAARAWLNWTKEELAKRAGVSLRTVSRFESNSVTPYPHTAAQLRAVLEGVGIVFSFTGSKPIGIDGPPGPSEPRLKPRYRRDVQSD
jgi:transcriptional regulator with XRE-family HTH domain